MDELIGKILDIEKKAQEVMRDARSAKTELNERVTLDSIKMQNDIEKQAREKNESIRQMEVEETVSRVDEIKSATEKSLASLEEKYSQNKDKWVESIVNGVIGGSDE